MSNSLQPLGPQPAKPPSPSPTPRVYSNLCPLSRRCHPTISSSVSPFSCPQSFPASGSFFSSKLALHIRWPKYWSFIIISSPSNEYSVLISFRMYWFDLLVIQGTGLISFRMDWFQGTLRSLLQHHSLKASILAFSLLYG